MTILLFKLGQLFMLLLPELVVAVVVPVVIFPSEPNFVQNFLSILSKFVRPLPMNPMPKRLVCLAALWHQTMTIVLFELCQPFAFLHVPFLIKFRHGS
jgi:hypothetical protein